MQKFTLNGDTMGARYHVVYFAEAEVHGLDRAIHERISEIDAMMTTYNSCSNLMKLNATPIGEWIEIPKCLEIVLRRAELIREQSGGAFNPAIGGAVLAWGFGASQGFDINLVKENLSKPSEIDLPNIELKSGQARKLQNIKLDLSAIAKGFGVDAIAEILADFDIQNAMVNIDGEIRTIGKMQDKAWPIAVEAPHENRREVYSVIEIEDGAVATSGDYRHFVDTNLGRMSHIIDPKRGGPLKNDIASVTMIADCAIDADAWATALMVMGKDEGLIFAAKHHFSTLFIWREGGELNSKGTGVFATS